MLTPLLPYQTLNNFKHSYLSQNSTVAVHSPHKSDKYSDLVKMIKELGKEINTCWKQDFSREIESEHCTSKNVD